MSEDEESRSSRLKAELGDTARAPRREPPLIEGSADESAAEHEAIPPARGSDEIKTFDAENEHVIEPSGSSFEPILSASPELGDMASVETAWQPEHGSDDHTAAIEKPEEATTVSTASAEPFPGSDAAPFATQTTATPDRDAGRPSGAFSDGVPVPPPIATRSRWGAVAAILSLLIVCLLAAIAYWLYANSNSDRSAAQDAAISDLKTRLSALEARPVPPTVDVASIIAPINKRLDGLGTDVAGLKTALADAQKRVDTLAATPAVPDVAAVQSTAPSSSSPAMPDLAPQLTALNAKVADLATELNGVRSALADLPKPDFGPVNAKVGDLEQKLAGVQDAVNGLPRVDLGPINAKVETLDSRLKPIEAEAEAAKSPQRVTDARQNGSAAENRAAPLAVTAQAVSNAIDSGRAFPQDLKALQNLGASGDAVAPLQAVAGQGAPTLNDLRADLAALRDRMVAQGVPQPTGSYMDRILAGAGTLVKVRPLGSVVGDTPAAIVARMDADIGSDDLAATLAEWQKLPDASRTVSKGLADRIKLRLDAETAAKSIAANAISAMAAPKE